MQNTTIFFRYCNKSSTTKTYQISIFWLFECSPNNPNRIIDKMCLVWSFSIYGFLSIDRNPYRFSNASSSFLVWYHTTLGVYSKIIRVKGYGRVLNNK